MKSTRQEVLSTTYVQYIFAKHNLEQRMILSGFLPNGLVV